MTPASTSVPAPLSENFSTDDGILINCVFYFNHDLHALEFIVIEINTTSATDLLALLYRILPSLACYKV